MLKAHSLESLVSMFYVVSDIVTPPQERRPAGICPDSPSLQHLHHWPANHRLQKVCMCRRSSNHACWWRLAGSGKGVDQGHGNCRWIPPDLEAKAQHYKNGVGSLPSLTTRKLNVSLKANTTTQPCPSAPSPHTSEYRWTGRSRIADTFSHFARSSNSANSHPSPGPFNRRVLRACLVPQCSYPPHRPRHQWRLAPH